MTSDRRRITRMIAAFVKRDPGAQARIAAMTGTPESTVAHWFSDEGQRQYSMPVDVLPQVVDALDKPEIYAAIVAENGLEPPAPRARPTHLPGPPSSGTLALLGHTSRIGLEVERAAADGSIDPDEAVLITTHLDALIATAQAMKSRLPRRA